MTLLPSEKRPAEGVRERNKIVKTKTPGFSDKDLLFALNWTFDVAGLTHFLTCMIIFVGELTMGSQILKDKTFEHILSRPEILCALSCVPLDILLIGFPVPAHLYRCSGADDERVRQCSRFYRSICLMCATVGFFFLLSAAPFFSSCRIVPCYAKNRTEGNACDLCTHPLSCPAAWGNPAKDVALCRATSTKEFPSFCGNKLCHSSFAGQAFFGSGLLDCDGGVNGDIPFHGFPLPLEAEMEKHAQSNCLAQQWIVPSTFGFARVVYALHLVYTYDRRTVEHDSKTTLVSKARTLLDYSQFHVLGAILAVMYWLVYSPTIS